MPLKKRASDSPGRCPGPLEEFGGLCFFCWEQFLFARTWNWVITVFSAGTLHGTCLQTCLEPSEKPLLYEGPGAHVFKTPVV